MRMFLLIVATTCIVGMSKAEATVIDLGLSKNPPDVFYNFVTEYSIFDTAASGWFDTLSGQKVFRNGWVSKGGALDGGQYFFTDLFERSPTNNATIWWDFADTNYRLKLLMVFGRSEDRGAWFYRSYDVTANDRFASTTPVSATLPDGFQISSIEVFGLTPTYVPEGGTTLLFTCLGIFGIACARAIRSRGLFHSGLRPNADGGD